MIIYFADRKMNILGQASTELPAGLTLSDDLVTEDIETGVAVFECKVHFDKSTRKKVEACTEAGNYILRQHDGKTEFYTITEPELNTKKKTVYIYAEDAGLDLLNEVVGEYEPDKEYGINHYIEKFTYDSGFVIGTNEAKDLVERKLIFDNEETVTARLASIAQQFNGCEISYTFDIDGLLIKNKYINIHKERGQDHGVTLRLNKDVDSIVISKSITNLATALRATGGTPDGADNPITLRQYEAEVGQKYDDGDFYIDGDCLKSRTALKKWSRYIWSGEPNLREGHEGHIVKLFSFDTPSAANLLAKTKAELTKIREMEVNYEVDLKRLPKNVRIGDRVNIVDEEGELYLSSRILQLKTSVCDEAYTATIGEHLIKNSGIHMKVQELAAQFATTAISAAKALSVANRATAAAEEAKTKADTALDDAEKAQQKATEATTAVQTATQAAEQAQQAANNAQTAVDNVENRVNGFETSINNAQQAASNAQQAAGTAEQKANQAVQDAANAIAEAAKVDAAVKVVEGKAESAITKAEQAQGTASIAMTEAESAHATAEAAKLDADQAEKDIVSLGERLTTVSQTMEADYARKTQLTATEAKLQSQISQNAGLIQSTVRMMATIDETANDAQDQAEKAQLRAEEARRQANQAVADAEAAQNAADEAEQAYDNAQEDANSAQLEAEFAQQILNEAEAELEFARACLEEVLSNAESTEEEVANAQANVEAAKAAVNSAKPGADAAVKAAEEAQETADKAQKSADEAQATANTAASLAQLAQSVASEAENAYAAQTKADEAAQAATNAKTTADNAKQAADDAKAEAKKAADDAAQAVADAEEADALAVQAAANLVAAKQHLAEVLAEVEPSQSDIEAAQAAVEAARINAENAIANATKAAAYAAQAAIEAEEAREKANAAKTAADNASAAAYEAQKAADDAKDATDALAVRVIDAETQISQNAQDIVLRATKKEVADTLAGYSTTAEMNAALSVKADEISATVSLDYEKTVSRGEQLVTNGNGQLGTNYNWTGATNRIGLVFDGSVSNNSPGSFTYPTKSKYVTVFSDEFIPVNTNKRYTLTLDMKSENGLAEMYGFLSFYDSDKNIIASMHHGYVSGTLTTLTQELKNGDTVVHLSDVSKWVIGPNGILVWNYANSFGYIYPPETYSRHTADLVANSIDYANNTVTLKAPWSFGTVPVGTSASQRTVSGTYKYLMTGIIPAKWKTFSGYISGVDYTGKNVDKKFPPGVAYAKVGILWNLNASDDQIWATNITVQDTTADSELASRMTSAETKIAQTDNKIALTATKTELASVEAKVDGIEVGGRNLLAGSDKEYTATINEFLKTADLAPIFDKYGLIEYTISFDIKSADISQKSTMMVYCQNGNGAKYNIGDSKVPVTTEYTRQSVTITPENYMTDQTESFLAFFGKYGTGNKPSVKNIKVERGNKATDWTPAPEDVDGAIVDSADDLRQTITNQNTSLLQSCESIILSAVESRVEKAAYDEFKEAVSAQMKLLSDSITMNFNTAIEQVKKVNGDLQTEITERKKHINFDADGITIVSNENSITMNIDNDQLVISKNGVEAVRIDINNAEFANVYIKKNGRLRLGNFGFTVRDDGTPVFGKVGG